MPKRILQGRVTSDKNEQTVTVLVEPDPVTDRAGPAVAEVLIEVVLARVVEVEGLPAGVHRQQRPEGAHRLTDMDQVAPPEFKALMQSY